MKKIVLLILLIIAVMFNVGFMHRNTRTVTTFLTAHSGDTMYSLCDKYYVPAGNTESFNAFLFRNYEKNGTNIVSGQKIQISNVLYDE